MKLRVLLRALWHRRGRALVAFGAVAIACSLAVSMLQVALDAGAKLRGELRVFGANVALLPLDGAGVPAAEIDRFAAGIGPEWLRAYSPILEATATAAGQPVALVGVRWSAAPAIFAYWRLDGGWPKPGAERNCLVGAHVARRLRAGPGSRLTLRGGAGVVSFQV